MNQLKLKFYRENSGKSQREISELIGLTQQAYSRWEKGLSLPNAKQIVRLCEIFKCTPNDLFGFSRKY
ncbi:MAG: helix-turn-helix transcriptional regulator [Acholeplasmataceae bacterium]